MKILFLGGCEEVGRSAIAIKLNHKYLLMDYGVMMNHEIGFPAHIPPKKVAMITLSHAHLDHSGLTPLFYLNENIPFYSVEPTLQFSDLLIQDMIKLSGYYLPYEYIDLQSMLNNGIPIDYEETIETSNAEIRLLNAGHIPGSSQIQVNVDSQRILYTGDFNTVSTRLVPPAKKECKNLDAIIIESTYATEDHPERKQLEKDFVSTCVQIVEDGGTVLVPAFGVGRSQEILSILYSYNFPFPIFVDGMALKAIRLLLDHPNSLKDSDLFIKAVNSIEWVNNWKERRRAAKTPSVIISPAGMLKGGSAIFYTEQIVKKKKNAIILVSYQIPGTPGSLLLEKKKFMIHGRFKEVAAQVFKFDFSSHVGQKECDEILSNLDPKTKVFTIHGDKTNCQSLSQRAQKEYGLDAVAPIAGDTFEI